MAIRTLTFTATPDGITPVYAQKAGVSGEHNATNVVMDLSEKLITALSVEDAVYRFEIVDGLDQYDTTENFTLSAGATSVSVDIPNGWTAAGQAELRLVIAQLDVDNNEELILYSFPCRLLFEGRDTGTGTTQANLEKGLSGLIEDSTSATAAANTATGSAHEMANLANTAAMLANEKAGLADTAATNANNAADLANEKSDYAQTQGQAANTAANYAHDYGLYANIQGDYAQAQGDYAKTQGEAAQTAADTANTAASLANEKAGLADTAANNANEKAYLANTAGAFAQAQGQSAQTATDNANTAAQAAQTISDTVQTKLDNGDFIGEKGDKGDPGEVTQAQFDTTLTTKADKVQEAWITPTLLNGWKIQTEVAPHVGYFKDSMGIVHMRGFVTGGAAGTIIFHLPEGYRPAQISRWAVYATAAFGSISIVSNGAVYFMSGANTRVSLNEISFRAEG